MKKHFLKGQKVLFSFLYGLPGLQAQGTDDKICTVVEQMPCSSQRDESMAKLPGSNNGVPSESQEIRHLKVYMSG